MRKGWFPKQGFLCLLIFSILPAVQANLPEPTPSLKEGLRYQRIVTPLSQIVHLLEIDPQKFHIQPKHAKGTAKGLETLETLAKQNKALAAINGGFFHHKKDMEGLPAGILKIDNNWYGIAYGNRAAIGWSNSQPVLLMDRIQTKTVLKIKQKKYPVNAVNMPASPTRAVLFTDSFGSQAHSTESHTDYVIQNNQIIKITSGGTTEIPKNGYVYSLSDEIELPFSPEIGNPVSLNIEVIPQLKKEDKHRWQQVDNIVGGIPLLIKNNRILVHAKQKQMQTAFAFLPRARTALGILKNGHWVFAVVENLGEKNPGMSLLELAEFLKDIGCEQALNLDGGSSSALYLDNKIISAMEEKFEEPLAPLLLKRIADSIMVVEK